MQVAHRLSTGETRLHQFRLLGSSTPAPSVSSISRASSSIDEPIPSPLDRRVADQRRCRSPCWSWRGQRPRQPSRRRSAASCSATGDAVGRLQRQRLGDQLAKTNVQKVSAGRSGATAAEWTAVSLQPPGALRTAARTGAWVGSAANPGRGWESDASCVAAHGASMRCIAACGRPRPERPG